MANRMEGWLGHVANIGVIVGLLLVAYQVSQTNAALERESREWATATDLAVNEMYNSYRGHLLNHMDVWSRGGRGEPLKDSEEAMYDELAFGYFWMEAQGADVYRLRHPDERDEWSQRFARQILDRIYGNPGHEAQFNRWARLPGTSHLEGFVRVVLDVRASEYEARPSNH